MLVVCLCAAAVAMPCAGAALAEGSSDLYISAEPVAGAFAGQLTGAGMVLAADAADGGTPFGGFAVTDGRGTGAGWYVTVSATRLENTTYPGKDFALDSLTMPRLAVESADASCTAPPGMLHAAATVDDGGDGVVMVECTEHGQGMGTYLFTPERPWTLAVTARQFKGTYVSTITTTVATMAL